MKKINWILIIIAAYIFTGCTSSKKPTGVWVNTDKIQGKSFHKIFFVVMTADIEARVQLENDLAAEATSRGLEAVKSSDVMAFSLKDPKAPAKDEIVNAVKTSGCDAVFVAALLKKDESVRYTPGKTAYTVMPYYSYSGSYYGYYTNWYPSVSTPGYYSDDKSYFIQSNLYDVASEEIMWSAQSKVFNPSDLKKFSRSYVATLVDQLQEENLLKK